MAGNVILNSFLLNDKVALITGAASGLGLATVKAFLAADVRGLLLVDLSQEHLDRVFRELSIEEQQRCQCFVTDVSLEADNYANRALELWGRLDIAVLNAGIVTQPTSILDTKAELWDKVMQVNGRGVFLGVKQCGKVMTEKKSGSIVITASQLGLQAAPSLSAYGASKFAARSLALTAAEEFAPFGVRVNSVCPGPTITPMIDALRGDDGWTRMADQCLMKRLGQAHEIANAILYLSSDAASFCTGTTLKVDGGFAKFGRSRNGKLRMLKPYVTDLIETILVMDLRTHRDKHKAGG